MKIKHDYDDGPGYLTKGRVYELHLIDDDRDYGMISADNGCVLTIWVPHCAHIGGRPWMVVE